MTSREEKLAAARKKLRAYIGQNRENEGARVTGSSNTSSPSPSLTLNDVHRSESPVERARMAWERRETLDISDAEIPEQLSNNLHQYYKDDSPVEVLSSVAERSAETSVNVPQTVNNVIHPRDYGQSFAAPAIEQQNESFMLREAQLQEQLRRQGQAINVLVTERNDAQTVLSRVQAQLHEKSDALEELKHIHVTALDRIRTLEENRPPTSHVSVVEEEKRKQELLATQQKVSTLEEQLVELRQKLEGKKVECESLSQDVRLLRNDLSVADVRIQQLSVSETSVSSIRIDELESQKMELEGRVGLLERRLQAAAVEGEQAGHRFQMYADQCTAQITALRNQLRDLTEEVISLKSEKERLTKQTADLQESIVSAKSEGGPLEIRINALIEENSKLAETINLKEGELVALQAVYAESQQKISGQERELECLLEHKRQLQAQAVTGHADPALLAAMESDKVAASRAVSQNHKLKETLADLEAAYVHVSNEKSELIDKLTTQEHQNRELLKQIEGHAHGHDDHGHCDHHHDDDESDDEELDVDALRHQMALLRQDKTELILRLQALSAGGVQNHQRHDSKHGHDRKHDHHGHNHEEHNHDHDHSHSNDCDNEHSHSEGSQEEVEELQRVVAQLQEDKAELLRRLGAPSEDPQVQGLLEEKLRKTMAEIAVLDEEKQRLDHLVLQLQGETETIGEYISLYQKQRQLLKKRSIEKDEQLEQLTRDREDLKEKLASLNELVNKLIVKDTTAQNKEATGGDSEDRTAERIRALITEIENNNVVTAHSHGVEHCFCCSGQLQTV